ncbi:cannabinoid receptor 1 isoform X1 [Empidonax traillii]|uniref:cannabinoid receptor 1 isoform X1 n=2 Tax=Empidonax traillii TaxID=164674 RepID=UPI000FFD1B20|nr:cannabinoid receptor 1 isoform X1 [Empidonax traillii]
MRLSASGCWGVSRRGCLPTNWNSPVLILLVCKRVTEPANAISQSAHFFLRLGNLVLSSKQYCSSPYGIRISSDAFFCPPSLSETNKTGVMKSVLDGLADTTFRTITTDLLYVASNDIQYEDMKGDMASKLGYYPQKFPLSSFRGDPFQEKMTAGDDPLLSIIPSDQVNITEFYNKSLSTFKDNEENIQCGENFMDMECFMILNPSQQLAIAVLSLTLGTFTVLENLLVLCVILHSRSLRCRPSYHFIGSLAVADLLGSVIFVYSFVDFHVFHRKDSPNVFLFKLGGVTASFTASVGSLFLTAIDRYISIHRPLAYKRIVTRPKAVVAFCVMWTIAIVIAVLPLLGWNCKKLNSVCSDIFPLIDETYLMFWIGVTSVLLLFIVYAYMYILWKAHSHAVRMLQRGTQKSIIVQSTEDGSKVQITRPDQTRMDIRLAKTLVLILVVLIICWGPLLAIMVYDVFGKMNKLIKTVFAFCSMLCLLNSTVNPIIYALRSKDLRHAFRSMFPTCKGTAQPLDNSMESDCQHKHANNAGNVHRAAESCIKSTVKIAKVTMSVSTDTTAEAL